MFLIFPLNRKIKFTSLELCISKIVGDLLLVTLNLLTLIKKHINVPTTTLIVSDKPLIFVKFLERFQVSSSQIQSLFFHCENLIALKEIKTN